MPLLFPREDEDADESAHGEEGGGHEADNGGALGRPDQTGDDLVVAIVVVAAAVAAVDAVVPADVADAACHFKVTLARAAAPKGITAVESIGLPLPLFLVLFFSISLAIPAHY